MEKLQIFWVGHLTSQTQNKFFRIEWKIIDFFSFKRENGRKYFFLYAILSVESDDITCAQKHYFSLYRKQNQRVILIKISQIGFQVLTGTVQNKLLFRIINGIINLKQNQLKKILQLADHFSNQTAQISIVLQIQFLSSSYLKVIQQIDIKSRITLKVKHLNRNHQKILRKDNFKATQKIMLEFNEEILIYLSDFQQSQIDQDIGYQKSCLVEYSSKTLTRKYEQLKILFQSVISINKVKISSHQIEQFVLSMYQILQNGYFRLNLFFPIDLQTIFSQFDWKQIQIIHFTKMKSYKIQYLLEQLDCAKLAKFKHLKYVLIDIQLLRNKQIHPQLMNLNSNLRYLDQKTFQKFYQYNSNQSSIPIIILENNMDQSLINQQPVNKSLKKFKILITLLSITCVKILNFNKKIQPVNQPHNQLAKEQTSSSNFDILNDKDLQINFMKAYKNLKKANENGQYSPCNIF